MKQNKIKIAVGILKEKANTTEQLEKAKNLTVQKKIAITGGIGSGKSTVARFIKEMGYSVFSCDEAYAELLKDRLFLEKLSAEFGDIIDCGGELDREKLSEIVFSDKEELNKLNRLTHSAVFEKIFRQAEGIEGICFYEVPVLFEEGNEKLFDNVIVILRDKEKRINSVKLRDNFNDNQILKRLESQIDYDNFNFAKYYVIHNNNNFEHLRLKTHEVLRLLSSNSINND